MSSVPGSRPLRLRTFPPEDVAFRRHAEAALGVLLELPPPPRGRGGAQSPHPDPLDLQQNLRGRFPSALVHPREGLADPGYGPDVWYVYRFGSLASDRAWWEEPGHAWAVLDDGRTFAEVSSSFAEIVEAPREAIVGRAIEAFANPDDASVTDDIAGLWQELLRHGQLHSTLRFRRLDGSQRELEYHATVHGGGPGRHLLVVREIEPS